MNPEHSPLTLAALHAMERAAFTAALGGVLEHSPHFAARAWERRPFASAEALLDALMAEVHAAPAPEQEALLTAHPDLGARLGTLTADSAAEQRAAGLTALDAATLAELHTLNADYRARFGFPFIVCALLNSPQTILSALRTRVTHEHATEFTTALSEIRRIARLRLDALLTPPV